MGVWKEQNIYTSQLKQHIGDKVKSSLPGKSETYVIVCWGIKTDFWFVVTLHEDACPRAMFLT